MPRLQPRPSSRRPSGIENAISFNVKKNGSTNTPIPSTSNSPFSVSTPTGEKSSYNERTFTFKKDTVNLKQSNHLFKEVASRHNGTPSPSRVNPTLDQPANSPIRDGHGKQHKHLLLNYSSTTSNSSDSGISEKDYSDFSLTPPTAGSRPPLLVSAKNYGNEIRRQNTKVRVRRRRPFSTKSISQSGDSWDAEDNQCCEENNNNALYLLKGDSPGEIEECLPLPASSNNECEHKDRIEEVVRAEHLKEAMIAQGNKKLQLNMRSFSASRAPPPKGCLSNPRPKRPRGQTSRYKTPPKSADQSDGMSESNVQETRRVQFGMTSAVEYEIDRPSGHLTPMSQEVTRKRYSMNPKEPSEEENNITQETKQNNLILSEWEDQMSKMRSSRKRSSDRLRRNESSNKRNRRNRRSSTLFSPQSRISLVCDDLNTNRYRKGEKDVELTSISSDSKPAMIMTHSATPSLLRSKNSLNADTSDAASQTTSHGSTGRLLDDNQTWDFVADLRSINSKGAMGLSPSTSSPATKESSMSTITKSRNSLLREETIHSPADGQFDIRNKFIEAIGNDLPNCYPFFQNNCSSRDSAVPCSEQIFDSASDKISKTLVTAPWLDQEWDFVSLLRNLSFFNEDEVVIERIFRSFDPCFLDISSSLGDFIEHTMRDPKLKSSLQQIASKDAYISSAKRATITEWKEIELSFIQNLIKLLNQFRSRIEKMSCEMNKNNYCIELNGFLNSLSEKKKIEKEISALENGIREQKSLFDELEASTAPATCILCQATAQIGIYGFNFEEFCDEQIMILDYKHAIFDVKTRVLVDIDSQSSPLIEHNVVESSRKQGPIFCFHQGCINRLRRGETTYQLNDTELQDSLLRLAQILGKLDRCALALNAISEEQELSTITVDLPHLLFAFPNHDTKLTLTLDLKCFVTEMISVSSKDEGGARSSNAQILASVDCCDLKSLRKLFSNCI
mmetsp:Transcript_15916/g.36853  ORF Transcript_15916/g.36853 Transcript_15916/m.36853 type:complete len:959 (+) Transcript_15916:293-3169(+)